MPQKSQPERETTPSPRRRWWRFALIAYALLLALSHLFRFLTPPPPAPEGRKILTTPVVKDGHEKGESQVRLAYIEWPAPGKDGPKEVDGDDERPVILLLHGSPGSADNFRSLGPMLQEHHRVLAVDLPGFGASESKIPDYSIEAHAHYVLDLLNQLQIDRVHAVGFSMGGGVVLHLQEMVPDRVESVVMLAAIGVQELEMLGQYHLNHALHGMQWALLWGLVEATPHFGRFDGSAISFARNFYDTDQRPLRPLLEAFEPPMLILHGEGDVLVPYAAAVEHHRIVPQSELVTFPANHFMVFREPSKLATPLLDFFAQVEAGTAPRRADATPARRAAAEDPTGFKPSRIVGFALVITLILLALSTLGSEDLSCIAAGLLVAQGRLGFVEAAMACAAGIFLGDLMLYFVGRLGHGSLHRAPLRWFFSPRDLQRSQQWFSRRGPWVILISRFVPGTRLPTYLSAGILKMPLLWFTLSLLIPVAIWTPFLVGISRYLGESFFATFGQFQKLALPGFAAFLITLWLLLGLGRSLLTWKGRRRLLGRLRRLRQWEFWPPWIFYPPIVLHILKLGLRYRSLTLFTAANPGIPAGGGFIGESKSTILRRLDSQWVARFEVLSRDRSLDERLQQVLSFQERLGLGWPIVLKPDQGQRGSGVVIARSDESIREFLRATPGDAIVQEYIAGPELGIFYVRRPGEARGRIFSVTEKLLPNVLGDGHSTIEHLVLADERAIILSDLYLDRLQDRLEDVPEEGQLIPLAQLGTHCRGAVFLDGANYLTPQLEAAVEAISRSFEGFYFGRFDLRAPDIGAFAEGRGLKVLELNGVTSEATHIYDPKNRLAEAYRVLREQWSLAFEIGDLNRQRGEAPLSVLEIARLLFAFRQSQKLGRSDREAVA